MRALLASLILASTAHAAGPMQIAVGWEPSRLYPAAYAWHRADCGVTLNGATVSDWAPCRMTGNSFVQGTAGAQPTYTASSPIGSRPSLLFDGTSDMLAKTISGFATTANIRAVISRVALSATDAGVLLFTTAGANDYDNAGSVILLEQGAGQTNFQIYRNSAARGTKAHPGTDVKFSLSARFDGSNATLRVNNSDATAVADTNSFATSTHVRLGARYVTSAATNWWNGHIAEVLIMDRVLTTAEIAQFEAYSAVRYGTP